jgi:hypothetical protein
VVVWWACASPSLLAVDDPADLVGLVGLRWRRAITWLVSVDHARSRRAGLETERESPRGFERQHSATPAPVHEHPGPPGSRRSSASPGGRRRIRDGHDRPEGAARLPIVAGGGDRGRGEEGDGRVVARSGDVRRGRAVSSHGRAGRQVRWRRSEPACTTVDRRAVDHRLELLERTGGTAGRAARGSTPSTLYEALQRAALPAPAPSRCPAGGAVPAGARARRETVRRLPAGRRLARRRTSTRLATPVPETSFSPVGHPRDLRPHRGDAALSSAGTAADPLPGPRKQCCSTRTSRGPVLGWSLGPPAARPSDLAGRWGAPLHRRPGRTSASHRHGLGPVEAVAEQASQADRSRRPHHRVRGGGDDDLCVLVLRRTRGAGWPAGAGGAPVAPRAATAPSAGRGESATTKTADGRATGRAQRCELERGLLRRVDHEVVGDARRSNSRVRPPRAAGSPADRRGGWMRR